MLKNIKETVIRATELTEFIKVRLWELPVDRSKLDVIDERLSRLLEDDRAPDRGLYELVCRVHALAPDHQFCPARSFSVNDYIGLCSGNIDARRSNDIRRLAHGLLKSMMTALRRVRHLIHKYRNASSRINREHV